MRILCTLFFSLFFYNVSAYERITHFHSDISLYDNGEMRVTENIDVIAEGNKIKRGIYRDFPTTYRDRLGNRYQVGFDIEAVIRNTYSEDYHTKARSNGVRIYFGHKNRMLSRGKHKYQLRYKTNRQLGFFKNYDELYWNVTGTDWDFPIEKASALIQLPEGIPTDEIQLEAYTGIQGAKGQNFSATIESGNWIRFETTKPLPARHGLTIVVSFPKGYIHEPTAEEELQYLLDDNRYLLYTFVGMLLLLAYYLFAWHKVGRDPEEGIIIAHYNPPKGYSPASMRFIEKMAYDKTCLASSVINLAVKGFLSIKENKDDDYVLTKTGKDVDMAPGEKALAKSLFSSQDNIVFEQSNHKRIKSALDSHEASLKKNYETTYFLTNTSYFAIGLLLTIIILAVVLYSSRNTFKDPAALFLIIWLTPWTFACVAMLKNSWHLFSSKRFFSALASSAFMLPFLFFEVMAAGMLVQMTSTTLLLVLLFACAINWIFYELLKSPTLAGRKLLDKIEGFRRYIELAEKHELDYKHPKGKSPELFEEYLPYALALNVEQQWAEQFADTLKQTDLESKDYSPSWYRGSHWDSHNLSGFTTSLGSSFSNAIASSSTAPGSSSGGGGGGSSGGGGGGGGGGGW